MSVPILRRLFVGFPPVRCRSKVRSCGICGEQSGTGASFPQVLLVPLPTLIQPIVPHVSSCLSEARTTDYNGRYTKWIQSLRNFITLGMCPPPLWSSGQSSWLQIRRSGFDSRHYQKKKVVGLERGPLSLVSTTEELLDRKVAVPV
jgi:hypothetical protein